MIGRKKIEINYYGRSCCSTKCRFLIKYKETQETTCWNRSLGKCAFTGYHSYDTSTCVDGKKEEE